MLVIVAEGLMELSLVGLGEFIEVTLTVKNTVGVVITVTPTVVSITTVRGGGGAGGGPPILGSAQLLMRTLIKNTHLVWP